MQQSVSIHNIVPTDFSGRYARAGFVYQDHISVSFCLCMLMDEKLKEVWLESHDDITLIWEDNSLELVELVQVKATNENSRWSISRITQRENSRIGTSIFEKSLNGGKFEERVRYRIVSLFDVNDDLEVLKLPIGCTERVNLSLKEDAIAKNLIERIQDIVAPNGYKTNDWVKNCFWDKRSDTNETLRASNIIDLEKTLLKFGFILYPDQRDELYQKFLALCQDAATIPLNGDLSLYKINSKFLTDWFKEAVYSLKYPNGGTAKLRAKLENAKLIEDYIDSAIELKREYSEARRSNDFMQPSVFQEMELAINGEMYRLKIALDNGSITEDSFHEVCVAKVDEILSNTLSDKNIPKTLAYGYMYDLTNRCLHRYKRANP